MSLSGAMFTGISGLMANAEGINTIGNNISNVNTVGFKNSRTLFSDMLSVSAPNSSQIGLGTKVQKIENQFSQSTFESTSNTTDVAISGNAFFALGKPGGNAAVATTQNLAYLTRAGDFSVDKSGYLVNPDGYQVLSSDGIPIQFVMTAAAAAPVLGDFSKITQIGADGSILYQDALGNPLYYNTKGVVGTPAFTPGTNTVIGIVTPPNPGGLEKVGGTLFKAGVNSGLTVANTFSNAVGSVNIANNVTNKINSNSLEQSNVDMATEFVKMILTQRAYSANSKTITTSDEMTQEVINMKR